MQKQIVSNDTNGIQADNTIQADSQMEIPKKFVESRTTNTIGKLLHGHHVAHHMPFRQEKSHVLELIRI